MINWHTIVAMLLRLFILLFIWASLTVDSHAFWVWTPESGKWENPKYAVKDTPQKQLEFAQQFYLAKDHKRAIAELRKLLKHYPRAKEAAEAQYYIALIQQEEGDLFAAFKSYQQIIEKYPFSERSGIVIKQQYEIGNALLEGKVKRNAFVKAVVGGDYDVVEVFRTVIKNAPYGEFAAPSQYKIGLYLLEKGMYQESRDEFEKTMNDYPDSEWAKAAKFQIALADSKRSSKAQYDQKVTASALNEFKDFLKKFPDADLSDQAKEHIDSLRSKEAESQYHIAEFYEKQKKYDAAKLYYNQIATQYSNTSWAVKSLEGLRRIEKKQSNNK